MAYQNYNPYYTPFQTYQMPQQAQQQPQQATNSMIWVAGQEQANSYPVCPNSAVNLWDSTAPCVYIKSADATGRPSMEIYDLVKRAPKGTEPEKPMEDFVTRTEFNRLSEKVERLSMVKAKKKEEPVNE